MVHVFFTPRSSLESPFGLGFACARPIGDLSCFMHENHILVHSAGMPHGKRPVQCRDGIWSVAEANELPQAQHAVLL